MSNDCTKKRNYFGALIKSSYIIIGLLIAALILTATLVNYEYGVIDGLRLRQSFAKDGIYDLVIIMAITFGAVTILLLVSQLWTGKVNLSDSLAIAFVLVGGLYFVYIAVVLKEFTLERILFGAINLAVGLAFITARAIMFKKLSPVAKPYKNSFVVNIYKDVTKKFSILSILATAVVILCVGYLVVNPRFADPMTAIFKNVPALKYFLIAVGASFLLYLFTSSFYRKTNFVDVILWAGIIALPLLAVAILGFKYHDKTVLITYLSICGAYLLAVVLRLFLIKLTNKKIKDLDGNYFVQLFKKFNPCFALFIAAAVAGIAAIILHTDLFDSYLFFLNDKFVSFDALVIPVVIVETLAAVTMALFLFGGIFTLKSKNVTTGDFMLVTVFLTGVLSSTILTFCSPLYFAIGTIGLTVVSFIFLSIRAFIVNENQW